MALYKFFAAKADGAEDVGEAYIFGDMIGWIGVHQLLNRVDIFWRSTNSRSLGGSSEKHFGYNHQRNAVQVSFLIEVLKRVFEGSKKDYSMIISAGSYLSE